MRTCWNVWTAASSPLMSMNEPAEHIRLEGRLSLNEVPDVHRRYQARIESSPPAVVDLGGLTASDSSTVALLVEWQAVAVGHGRRIEFHAPPEGLRTIARLTGVDHLLGWSDQPGTAPHQES